MNESMWEYELQCARVSVHRAESQEVCTGVADSIVKMFKELLYQVAPRLCALPACVPAPSWPGNQLSPTAWRSWEADACPSGGLWDATPTSFLCGQWKSPHVQNLR